MRTAILCLALTACNAGTRVNLEADGGFTEIPTPDAGAVLGTSQLDLYQSGSRIKARTLNTPDGAKTFVGWHDVQRNEDCVFLPAGDGKQRCLPLSGVIISATSTEFADPACTIPAVAAPTCPTTAPSTALVSASSCGVGSTYSAHKLTVSPKSYTTAGQTPGCVFYGNHVVYGAGDEIAPAEFVAGTEGLE